jgi:hypothetical protein
VVAQEVEGVQCFVALELGNVDYKGRVVEEGFCACYGVGSDLT